MDVDFLSCGLAFEFCRQQLQRLGKGRVDDVGGGARTAVSGIDQLDGADSRGQADRREIEQAFGVDHLAVVKFDAITLERAENLFDAPAQTIKLHDLLGVFGAGHRQGLRVSRDREHGFHCIVSKDFTGIVSNDFRGS